MSIIDILGDVGGLLLIVKVGIHAYLKRAGDKSYPIGGLGQYTKLDLMVLPIFDPVDKRHHFLKRLGNIAYYSAVSLLTTFLISVVFI